MNNSKCFVCVENFNRSNRAEIKCEYCDFISCRSCCEIYLLSQTTPHCMKSSEECGKIWTRNFLANNFTSSFIKTKYKTHQEQVLFEKELALMPETQLIIERQIRKEKKICQYTKDINELNEIISDLIQDRARLEQLRHNAVHNINEDYDEDDDETDGQESKSERKPKSNFMHRCSNEDCRGFLSSRWKCNLCETWTCNECQVNIGTNEEKTSHVCNSSDLETAKLIKKDSKPCPKCGILIFKISGCDQMYCTQCHTPFSWNTGMIEIGTIHNPHYYEYLRMRGTNIPRNPLDIVDNRCGRRLNGRFVGDICTIFNLLPTRFSEKRDYIIYTCQHINHLDHIVIAKMVDENNFNDNSKQNNRIRYLKKYITEDEFKKIIQANEKRYQKNQELINLYRMVSDTATDLIHTFYNKLNEVTIEYDACELNLLELDISKFDVTCELKNLQIYANECLTNITKTYHCVHKYFDETFHLMKKVKSKPNDEINLNEE
jgi:hypothetical protein